MKKIIAAVIIPIVIGLLFSFARSWIQDLVVGHEYISCKHCNKTGVCDSCNGEDLNDGICGQCSGSKLCIYCDGMGKIKVSETDGTKSVKCSVCHGDGRCIPCGGSGTLEEVNTYTGKTVLEECRYCNGSGACNLCSGSGRS